MKRCSIKVLLVAYVLYDYKYEGELSQKEVNLIIKTKYKDNLWEALDDGFIYDIDSEIVEEVLL